MKSKTIGLVIPLLIFLISTSAFAAQYNFTPRASVQAQSQSLDHPPMFTDPLSYLSPICAMLATRLRDHPKKEQHAARLANCHDAIYGASLTMDLHKPISTSSPGHPWEYEPGVCRRGVWGRGVSNLWKRGFRREKRSPEFSRVRTAFAFGWVLSLWKPNFHTLETPRPQTPRLQTPDIVCKPVNLFAKRVWRKHTGEKERRCT